MNQLPTTSEELIKQLNIQYPHRCPHNGQDPTDMWMYAGARQLIDCLMYLMDDPEDDEIF